MDNTSMMHPVALSEGLPLSFIAQHAGIPFDFETDFEPQTRARSNTWPLPRPEGYTENNIVDRKEVIEVAASPQQVCHEQMEGLLPSKKGSSRRNAWGNLSYADLITQAISSSPENRLTLSEIYNWMIQNVPYFKDKGDSNSSAGWKNSIRHNLSLHNIFMRVQNEGTGKSSWWTLNPDAKPGKSSRRRAASMETSKFEKLRGRVKKKVKALRNGIFQAASMTPSPCSSITEGLDVFPESPFHPSASGGFRLSPDFRSRASSTASSVGRLSPIPAVLNEPDWTSSYVQSSSYNPEELVSNLDGSMRLECYKTYQTSLSNHQQRQKNYQSVPSPAYLEEQYLRSHTMISGNLPYGLSPTRQNCPIHGFQPCACLMNQKPASGMSPSYQQSEPNHSLMDTFQQQHQPQQLQQQEQEQEQTLEHLIEEFVLQQQQQQQQQQNYQQMQQSHEQRHPPQSGHGGHLGLSPTSCTPIIPNTIMGQLMDVLSNNNNDNNNNNDSPLLDDLDINIEKLHNGLDRDDEEVIKNVLSMDDTYADLQFSGNNGLSYDLGLKL